MINYKVLILFIVYFLKSKLSGLSALFEEAGQCMINLPGLLLAPLIALIVLIGFLAFWVLVVICIATASAPGQNPIGPFDSKILDTNTNNNNNINNNHDNRTDYKSKLVFFLFCFL